MSPSVSVRYSEGPLFRKYDDLVFASDEQLELLRSATAVYFDATFKVVPTIYYQLFTVFAPFADAAFPVVYALMSRKTQALYTKVFEKVHELVPDFTPSHAMADFEEASVNAFRQVFGDVSVGGCWFHYAQAIIKRLNKLGLKTEYCSDDDVKNAVHSLVSLPLLPPSDMRAAVSDIKSSLNADSPHINRIQQLIAYVNRQWIDKSSIGPERLSVRDSRSRTNNVLESYHAALRRRIKTSHPNLFVFLTHLQNATTDQMTDVARLRNGMRIRRPKYKANMLNEGRIKACLSRYDNGAYTRMQFLRAVSHSVGAHTLSLQPADDSDSSDDADDATQLTTVTPAASSATTALPAAAATEPDCCEVCLVAPRDGFALVPCGHARFCESCANRVAADGGTCPVCRTYITVVIRVFL